MKRLLFLLLLTSCFLQSSASHLMGGEITWQCLPTGEYRFFMKLYRDCNGVSFPTTGISLDVSNKPGLTSIPMTIISQTDISPDCNANSGVPITCAGATGSTAGAVEEFYFQSNPIILNGVPPAAGWIFSYSNCCRNSAITNLPNAGGLGFTLRAIMYSFNLQNANPCFDSSPFFVESPNTIICSGYPFTYNPTAIDPEIDSLVYSWAQPLDDFTGGAWTASNPAPIGFSPGYSFTSPLPGPAQNPNNVAATLNSTTGEVSYTSFTNGVFVTVNKVSAYKCGIVIAEIFRDLQITLKVCNSLSPGVPNLPPTVTKPFIDPVTGNFTLTTDTVYAGEVVNFLMSATDFDYHPLLATNDPSSGGFQRLVFVANGAEFGANYTNPNAGCIIPPCATLSPPPPQPPVLAATAVTFNWQTSCAHLGYTNGCVNFSNEYTFIIKSLDDFCPAPGITTTTVKIVVLAPPQLNSPIIRCTDVLANGDVSLTWTQPIDTVGSFDAYLIYHSTNAAGPFTLIDSIFNLTTTNYLHVGANASNAPQYYQIVTRDLCKAYRFSTPNQTAASIHLTASNSGGNASQLNWNAVNTPLLSSSSTMYYIYREYPAGTWTLIDSTSALNYLDPININACNDSINYRIEIRDSINCISVSSIDGAWFQNITQPDPPIMHCIEADNNGSVTLSWVAPADTGLSFNGYYIYSATSPAGPFTVIDSIFNYNNTTYNHATANVLNTPRYYYLRTFCVCGLSFSINSDTLQAIRLVVNNVGGIAQLTWNPIHVPPLASSAPRYHIYKEYPAGVWALVDSTVNTSINIPILVCSDSINFRVHLNDVIGCVSKSTIDGATFVDNSVPDPPSLRCVTVNGNGSTILSWIAPVDTGLDFNSYHIYCSNNAGGPFTLIDSIFNYNTLSYTHATANAYATPLYYTVKTRTGCGVEYSFDSDTLQAIRLDVTNPLGGQIANLNWNAMHVPNLPTSAAQYNVYREFPAGTWTLRGTTAALNYLDSNPVCVELINYRIELTDASGCVSVSTIDGETFIDNTVPDAPSLRCVTIDAIGQAQLSWIQPVDTGLDFNSYHVSYSTSANGPFTLIDSIFNYNTTTYLHTGANANTTNIYYYVQSRTGCGIEYSLPSDTLHGIKLNVTNVGSTGIANLNWNELHNPLLPSSETHYKVFREYPTGSWTLLDSTTQLTYVDTINLCDAFINYRIEIGDASGCNSVSSIDGDQFEDMTPPLVTVFDSVSVNPINGNVNISWLPNASGDAVGYIIYLFNGASWDSIGNAPLNQLSYLYTTSNANTTSEIYNIAAYDSCSNLAPLGVLNNTILLRDSLDKCNASIVLRWNEYRNMTDGLQEYQIYMSQNNGPYNIIGTVPANTYIFEHTGIKKDSSYCYYVSAVSNTNSRRASSNLRCRVADVLVMPEFHYLKRVTVDQPGQVLIESYVDTAADVSRYELLRSDNGGTSYTVIAQQLFAGQTEISFIDNTAQTDGLSHLYKVVDVSTCNKPVFESNIGQTILLKTTPFENLVNKLEWNAYIDWSGGVLQYNIYRYYNGIWSAAPIATVPASSLSYFDNISSFIDGTGEFCYLVEAVEGLGNIYNYQMKSESNEHCAVQEPHLYLPNAFTPDGLNPIFKPYMIYYLRDGYQMQVFNRWGQLVFETGDTESGWNGKFKGEPAPAGVYVYHIKVIGANGKIIEKRGTISLLR
ncbi:MAG: gliding motility-associated C-terminal domain-containing protein [Bacteroidia bacterium]|nr:gliding motility-associated C-terminal domain-containing protein [Bacteroidia bacterium]